MVYLITSDKGYYCFDGVKDAIIFKNTYTISDNGAPYTGTLTGCEYDTLYSYTYFTIPKFAKAGPYRLDYWLLNGSSYKIAAFKDVFALVDSMNVWDPIGKWAVDTLTLTISGGKSANTYGQMKITRIVNGSIGYLEINSQLNSKGASVCFYSGTHEVIFKNNSESCQDILRVVITCDTSIIPRRPYAINDNVTVKKNEIVIFDPVSNDSLFAAPLRTLTIINPPKNGNYAYSGNTGVLYTPNTNFCGNDTFKYVICNNYFLCDTAFIFVNVTCDSVLSPKKPIAVANTATTKINTLVTIDILANDTPNGTLTSVSINKVPPRGTAVLNNNKIDYTPQKDSCNYSDTLQYKICNATGCDSANVYISVTCSVDSTPTNKKPVAVNDNFTTPKNITIRIKPTTNDTINGILSSLSVPITPKNGSIGFVGLDSLIYKPNQDFCGKDSFKYTICNNSFLCADAFVFITMTCDSVVTPKKPVAVVDNASTKKNILVTVDVLANDTQNGTLTSTTIIKEPRRGTAVLNNNKIDYTPQKDSCGYIDTLQYRICNVTGCDSAFVYVTVACDTQPTPKRPFAVNDNYSTPKNVTLRFKPTTNDNINGTLSSLGIVSAPKSGSISFISLDSLMYIPNKDFCGNDTIRYMICNTSNLCDTAFIFINVPCDTKKPVAVVDNASTKKNVLVSVDVLANDTQNGTLTSTTIIKAPRRGTTVLNNNKIDYTPQKDSCGYSDTLQYKICNTVGCDSAFVYVTVKCDTVTPAQKPIARTDIFTTKKNILVPVDVLANDTQNGILSSITITKAPRLGSAVLNNYKVDYTPQKDSCGYSDTLQYKICNAAGCDSAFVYVVVTCPDTTPTNKKPVAVNDNITLLKNVTARFKPTTNDNINGTLSSVSVVTGYNPKNGTIQFTNIDSLMYIPNKDFCGKDTFRYMVCNSNNLCDSAYVFLNVVCDNQNKPVAISDIVPAQKNKFVSIDVLANDTINGVLTSITIIKAPKIGTAVLNSTKIDYTPLKDVCNYNDTLQYKICNAVGCDSALVILAVSCDTSTTPKKPIAITDNFSTPKNIAFNFKPTLNDQINGTLFSFGLNTTPKNGTISLVGFDSLHYTPNKDFCGKDSLKYIICNNFFLCDTSNIFITVKCDTPAQKPIARTDISSTKKNVLVPIDVLANDTQNGVLTLITITKAPRRGSAVFNNYKIEYTPQKDSCRYSDTLQYKICNALGCDSAFVYVNVTCDTSPAPKKPIAVNDNVTTPKNVTLRFKPTANDNVNGTLSSLSIVSPPKNGSIGFINLDSLIYKPNKDFCGNDTIRYMICNTSNLCDTAYIFINVPCDAKKPVAVVDNASTKKNVLVTIDVLANDTQNCGTVATPCVTTTITNAPRRGSAVVNNGKIDYTPQKDTCNYSDTLQYKICNAIGCDSANVIILVTCPPDSTKKPVAVNDNASTKKNQTVTIDILANDTPNGTLTATNILKDPKRGKLVFNGNKIDYIPTKDSCGYIDTFQYRICNIIGCDSATVFVTVSCDTIVKPIARPDSVLTRKNTPIRISVLSNDQLNGNLDSIKITQSPLLGTATLGADNVITYTPDSCGFSDSLRYKICNIAGCDETYVKITVQCDTIKKPVAVPDNSTTSVNTPVTISVVSNDSVFGLPIDSIKVTANPKHGKAVIFFGKVIYTPDSNYCDKSDTLRYAVFTKGGSDTTNVFIKINCKRDSLPPVAIPDVALGNKNATLIIDVTANDTLRNADTFRITRTPLNGAAQFDSLNRIKYMPNKDFCGKDTLIYQIANSKGSDTAIVYININCGATKDSLPIANRDTAKTLVNQPVLISVTANDSLRGATTVVTIDSTMGIHGMALVGADGKTVTYTPFRNFFGIDSFRYRICNNYGCDTTTVIILIDAGDSIIVYNGFSPNGDGMNDELVIQGIDKYSDNEVFVWNRWGTEVFHEKGYSNSKAWDGRWNNLNVPDGTYYYCVFVNDPVKGSFRKTGYLQIQR